MSLPDYLAGVRSSYDTVAASYASRVPGLFDQDSVGRALLAAFAEQVGPGGGRLVADVGCGPGHVTAYLASLGLDAFGVDISPGQIEMARQTYPQLRFSVGSMTALGLVDGSLGGLVSWWSIVHTPPSELPVVCAEFGRVLAPDGRLVIGFGAGDGERRRLETAYGHPVSYDYYRHPPSVVTAELAKAGLTVTAHLTQPGERCPQVCLLAQKPR